MRVLTDNKNRTGPELRHIFEKNSGHMGTSGCVAWMFERRGLIQADAMRIKEDELLEKALDAGAADVKQVDNAFEIATAPDEGAGRRPIRLLQLRHPRRGHRRHLRRLAVCPIAAFSRSWEWIPGWSRPGSGCSRRGRAAWPSSMQA